MLWALHEVGAVSYMIWTAPEVSGMYSLNVAEGITVDARQAIL